MSAVLQQDKPSDILKLAKVRWRSKALLNKTGGYFKMQFSHNCAAYHAVSRLLEKKRNADLHWTSTSLMPRLFRTVIYTPNNKARFI